MPDDAFLRIVAPHERALRLHCYRMLGSSHDSDDMLQETLVRAWRAKDSLEDPSAARAWLYRIATNVCLDELGRRKRRPLPPFVVPAATDPTHRADPDPDVPWLEPCPDSWLPAMDPGAAYGLKESVALAFVAALQCLSARERAVLLLRDVVGMSARETASTLGATPSATNSALHRARLALRRRLGGDEDAVAVDATSEVDDALLARYIAAWESMDLSALVELLHDDIEMSMPPSPTWLSGKRDATAFLAARPFKAMPGGPPRLVPIGANGQPAVAFYLRGEPFAVHLLRIRRGRIAELHHFQDPTSFAAFDLPRAPTEA